MTPLAEPAPGVPEADDLFRQALALQRHGQVSLAEPLYTQILQLHPRHAGALHISGLLALERGAAPRACALIGQSIEANPNHAAAHADYANALQALGRSAEALASYDRAIKLKPDLMPAYFNKGVILQESGHLAEALASYERALALEPNFTAALYNRAVLVAALHRPEQALAAYGRLLQAAPNHVEGLSNRGVLLLERNRPDEALASFDLALAIAPRLANALNNRGNALRNLNRLREALASFDQALGVQPQFFEALRNRGDVLRLLGLPDAALAGLEAALRLRPRDPQTLLDRAQTLIDLKRHADAAACLTTLLETAPETDYARGLRLHVQGLGCSWEGYQANVRDLTDSVNAGRRADYPFPFLSVSDSAVAQARCARAFAADKYPAASPPLAKGKRYRHKKIRVAYISGDLRLHPVSALLTRVLESHDRSRFEILAISLRPMETSPMGQRVTAAFDEFIDVSDSSDHEVAALIRKRETDIAVDLMGFTQGARTGILARRPAPVQVNYLGFPGTMGARYMDYILADEFLIPANCRQHYTEKVVWLPECFQANDDHRIISDRKPTRRQLSLPDFGFVFCCFNNHYKLNPTGFDSWMRILSGVPGSVLWLAVDEASVRDNLRREARQRGVEAERLIFADRVPYADHLARLGCADLFLDTLPFNAGTTASDALWAGLPLLTCAGEALASRMAGSLLTAVGLPELITDSRERYEALAIELATASTRLAEFRARLESNRLTAPLFDSERFCRHLESAYLSMWERSERGKGPESFAVQPLPHAN